MTIDRQDLDALKLVQEENYAPKAVVENYLQHAVGQGSQGWGVTRDVATILTLARELRDALDNATAEEDHRKLKGLQLENGRLKKQIERLEAEALAQDLTIKQLTLAAGSDIPSSEGVDEDENS